MKTFLIIVAVLTGVNFISNALCGFFFHKTASETGYDAGVKMRQYFTGESK